MANDDNEDDFLSFLQKKTEKTNKFMLNALSQQKTSSLCSNTHTSHTNALTPTCTEREKKREGEKEKSVSVERERERGEKEKSVSVSVIVCV